MSNNRELKALLIGTGIVSSIVFGSFALSQREPGYFVSPDGADDNPGTLNRPFKTVQKCAEVVSVGETCWLREGIYRETITPVASGTPTESITFAAYKEETVTISGTELVDRWSLDEGSIYKTKVALPVDSYSDTDFFANQVFIGGKMMNEARFPNLGKKQDLLRPKLLGGGLKSQGGTAAAITNKEIPALTEGWIGAKVWANEWYTTRTGTITTEEDGTLKAEMTASWDRGAFWMYFFGKRELLDSAREWFYDSESQTLYLWSPDSDVPKDVEVKQRNFAFDLSDRYHITIRNLNLFANTITTSDSSVGIEIDGIKAKYVSHHMTLPPLPKSEQAPNSDNGLFVASHAHDTGIQLRGIKHTIKDSVVDWSSGNGVLLEGSNHTVTNNIILNTNYMVSYAAPVRVNGNSHKITHNTIKRTGRDAINLDWHTAGTEAPDIEIAYNDISRFGMLSTDLGAIYICCYVNLEGGSIHHNWIRDTAAFSPFWGTRGIYLDLESFNSTIHHNVVWNLTGGKDNYNIAAGSPRGKDRIYNNTFLGDVAIAGDTIEAQNNIFAATENISVGRQSHNLFTEAEVKFSQPPSKENKSLPDFTLQPDSPAVDAGVAIPEIKTDFAGKAPDIGAYERDKKPWQAGSTLEYNQEQ